MPKRIHLAAALLAILCIATFFSVTIVAELLASHAALAAVKSWIAMPGLLILVPAMALTGGTGFFLARARRGALVDRKGRRMRIIGANGLLVLVPCAVLLDQWAAAGSFDARFQAVQALELLAGALNLALMGLNMRDGLRLSGRRWTSRPAAVQGPR